MDKERYQEILRDMAAVAKEELGSGFVPDYYLNFASPFASAALYWFDKFSERVPDMATGTSSSTVKLFECPACKTDVTGVVSLEFETAEDFAPDAGGKVNLTAKVCGVRVSHDCVPKVAR